MSVSEAVAGDAWKTSPRDRRARFESESRLDQGHNLLVVVGELPFALDTSRRNENLRDM